MSAPSQLHQELSRGEVERGGVRRGLAYGLALSAGAACLLTPLPNPLLDAGVALSWALSVGFLTLALTAPPLSINRLPQWLLSLTVARLCLNIATTRAILSEARAGGVVSELGAHVMGEAWLMGVSFFVALLIIQLKVISKGAERLAELSARFALDALPGAQQALTHLVERGDLHPEEARRARLSLRARAELCGSLDGAMRFVKGDAYASLLLIIINALGGSLVGVWHQGLSWELAWGRYGVLTLGDGLVAQLPALLSAVGVAALLSRLPTEERGGALEGEGARHRALMSAHKSAQVAGVSALVALALTPLWPQPTTLTLGGLSALTLSWLMFKGVKRARSPQPSQPTHAALRSPRAPTLALVMHPSAARAVGGEAAFLEGWSRLLKRRGLPPRPLTCKLTREGVSEGCYQLLWINTEGAQRLFEGVALEGHYATFSAPPHEAHLKVRHPLWGLEGWWRRAEGGWSEACEVSALSPLALTLMSCYATLLKRPALLWRLDEVWRYVSEGSASLKSAALGASLEPALLLSLLRELSAEGVALCDVEATLEGLASLSALERSRLARGEGVSPQERRAELRRALGWERLVLSGEGGAWGDGAQRPLEPHLSYLLIDAPLDQPWGEETWAQLSELMRERCRARGMWAVLCAPERREALRERLSERAVGLSVLSWDEVPPHLTLEQGGWLC